ncbi:unknown [Clostridium sp. CAG:306]|mgnify:CR=1 FL=1|nr:unknown [Clostridium sp. CAG:306]
MERKIIIKNRQNHKEQLELTFSEFKIKFSNELKTAINTYKAHEESKNYLPAFVKPTPDYEQDFYFDIRWNFNNYAPTNYYIERII